MGKLHLLDLARTSVANLDDPVGRHTRERWKDTRTFGLHTNADVTATDLRRARDATSFTVHAGRRSNEASVHGLGDLSVSNALAVLTITRQLGLPLDQSVAALAQQPGPPGRMQIITVFGCGGDRVKRPIMGRVAAESADQIIITTDNPRTEDPDQIIAEIIAGTERP